METLNVVVRELDKKHFLIIVSEEEIAIPLSEDKPNEVKNAFNKLILRLKQGPCRLQFTGDGEDLFSQVAAEYVKHLNKEMREVRAEMEKHGLIEA
jgi:hypothetical protein